MAYGEWAFNVKKLFDSIGEIKPKFPVPDEMAAEDRKAESEALINRISGIDDGDITGYAARMRGRDVENILFAVLYYAPEDMVDKLLTVLEKRMSRRIITLIWAFITYAYDNPRADRLINVSAGRIRRSGTDTPQAEMVLKIFGKKAPAAVADEILHSDDTLNGFFKKYEISRESPLAAAVAGHYFVRCEKHGFILNEGWMIRVAASPVIDGGVLNNYLSALNEEEFSIAVNDAILVSYGLPVQPGDWPGVGAANQLKFKRWCFLRELREYCANNKSKYNCLIKYLPYFKNVKKISGHENQEILVVEFPDFYIVDTEREAGYSYLVNGRAFGRLFEGGEPALNVRDMQLFEGREYILDETAEDEDEEILRLNFQNVGKLYSIETIEIWLGLSPDTRASRSILAKKQGRKTENLIWGE